MAAIFAVCLVVLSGLSKIIVENIVLLVNYLLSNLVYLVLFVGVIFFLSFYAFAQIKIINQTKDVYYKCSGKDKKPKILRVCDLDYDFEDERKALWSTYHSQIQNHVGYSITTLIALIGLLASTNFLQQVPFLSILTMVAVVACTIILVYFVLRILYWSNWEGPAIELSKEQIVFYFNFCNSHGLMYDQSDNITASAILQNAIKQHLIDKEKALKWTFTTCLRKLAFLTGGIKGIPTSAKPPPEILTVE